MQTSASLVSLGARCILGSLLTTQAHLFHMLNSLLQKRHLCPFVVTFAEPSWCWQSKASADLEWLLYLSNLVTSLHWIACCSRAPIIFTRKNAGEWIHRVCASPPLCLSTYQVFLISSLFYMVFCSLANFTFLVQGFQTIPCRKPVQRGGALFIETSKPLAVNCPQQLYSSIPSCPCLEVHCCPVALLPPLKLMVPDVVSGWRRSDILAGTCPVDENKSSWKYMGRTALEGKALNQSKYCIWYNCRSCSERVIAIIEVSDLCYCSHLCWLLLFISIFSYFTIHILWSLCVCVPWVASPTSPGDELLIPWITELLSSLIPSKCIPSLWMMQWASYISLSCLVTRLTLMTNARWQFV